MTIKETEKLTGIPRASIRFYESEGLVSPSRDSNGYRNYSEILSIKGRTVVVSYSIIYDIFFTERFWRYS